MAVMGYFMILRPMRQRNKLRTDMMSQLQEGAEILSVGGIYGTVTEIRDEDLDVEIADGVVIRLNRRAIANVLDTPAEPADDVASDVADEQAD
jgi:preprotein translocase subunit YajC